MKKKLFGQNILPNCTYCDNATFENQMVFCRKSRHINHGKCKSFRYDPLLRAPKSSGLNKKYSVDDFKI